MPGRIATKGSIEYQLRVFERVSVVYIEVKLQVGTAEEHLNAVAQLIAESHGLYRKGPVLTFLYTIDINRMRLREQPAWIQHLPDIWYPVRRKIFRILSL